MITEAELAPLIDLLKSRGMSEDDAADGARYMLNAKHVRHLLSIARFGSCPRCSDGDFAHNHECGNFLAWVALDLPQAHAAMGAAWDEAAEESPWAPWRLNGPGVDEVAATLAREWGPRSTVAQLFTREWPGWLDTGGNPEDDLLRAADALRDLTPWDRAPLSNEQRERDFIAVQFTLQEQEAIARDFDARRVFTPAVAHTTLLNSIFRARLQFRTAQLTG